MSIIRDAVADIPFERIYQYDRQFRLRVAQNHAKTWAQIDGFVWLQFIAKGVSNAVVHDNLAKPCFNYNFKGVCYRFNCIYNHNCMKCLLVHPAIICLRFHRINGYQTLGNRLRFNNPNAAAYRPPLLNQNHRTVFRHRFANAPRFHHAYH